MTQLEMIRANARLAVETVKADQNVDLSFDRQGVEWLDSYLKRLSGHLNESVQAGVVNVMGSYFGECIVHGHGGMWTEKPGSDWVVTVRRRYEVSVNVFGKVEKQLAGVEGESVLSLFDIALLLAEKGTGESART